MTRRPLLSLGCAAVVAAFAHRVKARGSTDVEAALYDGAEDTHYATCNGSARMPVRYGGVGAEVRFYPQMLGEGPLVEPSSRGRTTIDVHRGLRVAVGAAVESVSGKVTEATGSFESLSGARVAGARVGVRATFGYDARNIGFHGGALLFTPLEAGRIGRLTDAGLPDLALRIGRLDSVRAELGVGAYSPAVLLRPGAYVGIGYAPSQDWDIALHYGSAWSGGDSKSRLDLQLRVPVSDVLTIGCGMAVQGEAMKPDGRVIAAMSF